MMTEIMRKDLEKRIDQGIAGKKSTLIEEVCELVRIKSVADKENEVKPFGQGCRDVVDRFIEIVIDMVWKHKIIPIMWQKLLIRI